MEPRLLVLIARQTFRDERRNRWVVLLSFMLGTLALALSLLGMAGLGVLGVAGFGRTAASLLNIVLFLVPLMGLLLGAVSIAGERENGTLLLFMAQPVTVPEILLGKFLGSCGVLFSAVLIGFGISGLVIARAVGWSQAPVYAGFLGLTLLFGMVHIALGLWISVMNQRVGPAIGIALAVWLAVIGLSDLGVMGTAVVLRFTPGQLLWCSLGNPGQLFRIASLQILQGNLELLGSSGLYASMVLGVWLVPVLLAFLACWAIIPVGIALWVFQRRGAL